MFLPQTGWLPDRSQRVSRDVSTAQYRKGRCRTLVALVAAAGICFGPAATGQEASTVRLGPGQGSIGSIGAGRSASGQHPNTQAGENLAQQLSNPVANLISLPFQNNFDYGGGRGSAFRYTLNFQPVIPFTLSNDWNLIIRTIVPFSHVERVFPEHATGLGDVVQSFFISPSRPTASGVSWGAGPVFLYPTATDGVLGQRQWGAGPTGVVLQQRGRWLYGALANHIWGLGGYSPDRPQVNATFLQPFLTYTFPTQTTVALNTESTYDWSRRQWTVPVNLSANQVVRVFGRNMQLGGGVRYYADKPVGGPDWGFRFTATLVFPSK